jgi:hypothetical protein
VIDQKRLENVACFKHLGSLITNDAKYSQENKNRGLMAKAAFSKKKKLCTSKLEEI